MRVRVEFAVPEVHLARLRVGRTVTARSSAYGERRFHGTVAVIDTRLDPATRSVRVVSEFDNADEALRPGLFMTVELVLEQRERALLVAEEAIDPVGDRAFVFVVRDGRARRQEVRLGLRLPGEVEVREGLNADEPVVVRGIQRLRNDAPVLVVETLARADSLSGAGAAMVLSDISNQAAGLRHRHQPAADGARLFAVLRMPIREYPAIDPPVIQITTTYTGASAPVVDSQITEILEAAVAGIEGIKTITSASRDERSIIHPGIRLTRDVDSAANDVRDKVARALARLPEQADTPVVAKVDGDSRPILWIALASDRFSPLDLTDLAERRIVDRLAIVEGVAQVLIQGQRRFSMRIWLDRQALAARNLTVQDVEEAIRRENVELPGGRIESRQRELTVRTDTRMSRPEQFREMVVTRGAGGAQVLLGEVARVEVAAEDSRGAYRINGRPAIGLGILRQSTANTLSVANGVKAEMEADPPEPAGGRGRHPRL